MVNTLHPIPVPETAQSNFNIFHFNVFATEISVAFSLIGH